MIYDETCDACRKGLYHLRHDYEELEEDKLTHKKKMRKVS